MNRFLYGGLLLLFGSVFAQADVVTFDSYTPAQQCYASPQIISSEGLTFAAGGFCTAVWDNNPNGNGTNALIDGYDANSGVTITQTGSGAFNLNSFDMTISWYDNNPSESVNVTANFDGGGSSTQTITLGQGLQTYNLDLNDVDSVFVSGIGGGYWLMDNVNFSVPEPSSLAVLGIALAIGGFTFPKRNQVSAK